MPGCTPGCIWWGYGVQLLHLPGQPEYRYEWTSDSRNSRWAGEASLERDRDASVSGATPTLAASEAARATIEGPAATHRSVGSMTTVKRSPYQSRLGYLYSRIAEKVHSRKLATQETQRR